MNIIGIDLGTTNSLVSVWKDGKVILIPNALGEFLTPSAVSVEEDGTLLVGAAAKERLISHSGFSVDSFKRFMGTKKTFMLREKGYLAVELSAMVLEKLKRDAEVYLQEKIEEAIITVPAYFNDKQRRDTKLAAHMAGLHTERLINEPSAASLAYRMKAGNEDQSLLVFDFGGGTLDLSLVECFDNVIEIIAVVGDNFLGGNDIDQAIATYFCRSNDLKIDNLSDCERATLDRKSEEIKIQLSSLDFAKLKMMVDGVLYSATLTQEILFELCLDMFEKIRNLFIKLLKDGGYRIADLNDIIMVGGSSRLPIVRRFLAEMLGKEPVVLGETDRVVAYGIGVYAGICSRQEEIRDMMMTDVCPYTLGVGVCNGEKDNRPHLLPMLERNCVLPSSHKERLFTVYDYQKRICSSIYQGEAYYADENLLLGEIWTDVEPRKAGEESIEICFTYDINGILQVEVVNSQGINKRILLANETMSKEELAEKLSAFEKLKIQPVDQEENRLLLAKAECFYSQAVGRERSYIAGLIEWFGRCLASKREYRIHVGRKEMEKRLADIEQHINSLDKVLFGDEMPELESEGEEQEAVK